MFHGAYRPKGFNRTYPNNMSREGVLGSEYNAWSDKPTAAHNCTIPFTGMLAGPLDYEPGLLDNATPEQFLSGGNYTATICKDGINAHRSAIDYVIEEKTLTANDRLQIDLAQAGGFLMRLEKE